MTDHFSQRQRLNEDKRDLVKGGGAVVGSGVVVGGGGGVKGALSNILSDLSEKFQNLLKCSNFQNNNKSE